MSRSNWHGLGDILTAVEAIDRAEAVAQRNTDDEELPEVVLAAIKFHVFTIGEAVKALSGELKDRRPDVPWSDIARMRDLIGHHYYKLDSTASAPRASTARRQRRLTASLGRGATPSEEHDDGP